MSSIPLESLLEPISEAAPSGSNLEYDPRYTEMERAAQPTSEQQYGDTIIEGKEPEWKDVRDAAVELLGESHDLRIGLHLTCSSLRTDGYRGFSDGLALLRGYIEKFWDTVHPQLDPDDDNDPTMRVNTLAGLCDNLSVLIPLRKATMVSSRTAGQFSRLDLAFATGELPFSGSADEKPKLSLIEAAFQDCPLEQLQGSVQAMTSAVENIRGIEASATERVGAGNMRSLEALLKEVDGIRKILAERLSRRVVPAATAAPAAATNDGASSDATSTSPAASNGARVAHAPAPAWNGEITSRASAIKAIESVCRYFERYEPSSPLPLLLHRAMRLSSKSFLEIMRDISPDGLSQAESLGGMSSEEYSRLAMAAPANEPPEEQQAAAPAPSRSSSSSASSAASNSDDY